MTEENNGNTEEQFFRKLISQELEPEAREVSEEDGVVPITRTDLVKTALAGVEVALGVIEAKGLATRDEIKSAMMMARKDIENRIEE